MGKITGEKQKVSVLGDVKRISIGAIQPNPGQPRKYFDEKKLLQLAESFELKQDVDYPIIVIPLGNDHRFLIVDGERRWRAARIAKLQTISCYVRTDIAQKDIFLVSVRANLCKDDMSPIEEAHAVVKLQADYNWTQAQVAKHIGKSPLYVCQVLKYLDLHEEIQALVICQKLAKGLALQLTSYPVSTQLKLLRFLEEQRERNNGKPLHPNDAARHLRSEAEKHGITAKKPARGKKHTPHATLVAKNALTKIHSTKKALAELAAVDPKTLGEMKDPHALDLINEMKTITIMLEKEHGRIEPHIP